MFSLQHDGPIKAIHWIKAPNYSCVMTGSWDKTLKVLHCLCLEMQMVFYISAERQIYCLLYGGIATTVKPVCV